MRIIDKRLLIILILLVSVSFSLNADNLYHIVRKGETLYSISRKYNVSLNSLKSANKLGSSTTIKVGSKLIVPGHNAPPKLDQEREIGFYTIKKGDTYYSVARKFKMKLSDLYILNNRNERDLLKVGFKLRVYGGPKKDDKKTADKKETTPSQKKQVVVLTKPVDNSKPVSPVKPVISVKTDEQSLKLPVSGMYKPMSGKLRGAEISVSDTGFAKSPEDGIVIFKGPFREFKNVILVDSGTFVYLFGGMDELYVNVGQKVRRGDRIGSVNPSGNSKIYFCVFKDRMALEYKDVINLINRINN